MIASKSSSLVLLAALLFFASVGGSLFSPARATAQKSEGASQLLFDDFNYDDRQEFAGRGWIARTVQGWPGVPGATWKAENVSFLKDPALPGNRLLRMTSWTGGTPETTSQTQICHQRKY